MDKPLFSENWYRVRFLKPQLPSHVKLHRQVHGGDVWYILEDTASGRYHRFNSAAYQIIAQMDGERTVEDIWDAANTALGDDAPVQDDIIQLLGQLHQVDVLRTDIPPDVEELLERGAEQKQGQAVARFRNPLSLKLRLFDPDRFLDRTLRYVAWLYTWPAMALWALVVAGALLLAASHWPALVETARIEALTPRNLLLLYLVYPCIKLLHELGHAYAAKLEGGEVHEIGIIFMVFIPVPYVDAAAANAFSRRSRRVLVGAAGIMTELFLAALALFVWLNASAGLVSSVCLNIMLIGGLSTVFFNGNPLLRFDGYYVLSDLVGIQNLAQRSNKYYGHLVQRYVFAMPAVQNPAGSRYESLWFAVYAPLSLAYRLGILAIICFFLLDEFFVVGTVLASWAVISQVILPLLKQVDFLLLDPRLGARRLRAVSLVMATAVTLLVAVAWLPIASLSRVEGVIYPPDNSHLVAETDGFVVELLAEDGSAVADGQPLLRLRNEMHAADLAKVRSRLKELQARYAAVRSTDLVEAKLAREEMATVNADIERLEKKRAALTVASPVDGVFYLLPGNTPVGRHIERGGLLGYVVPLGRSRARVVVTQNDVDRILSGVESVEVKLASRMQDTIAASLVRSVPQGGYRLPSMVLSAEGGGPFLTDPDSDDPLATRERVFEFEVALPESTAARIGTRVHVRFDHGAEPLLAQWRRDLRQLFLKRLGT